LTDSLSAKIQKPLIDPAAGGIHAGNVGACAPAGTNIAVTSSPWRGRAMFRCGSGPPE